MKKNILSFILLIISFVSFLGYTQYKKTTEDVTPPKIICEEDVIYVSVTASDDEILKGITAIDDKSGDVTDSLVIQGLSNFIAENERIITFAAIDDNMNVGTLEKSLVYTDYTPPEFDLKRALSFPVNSQVDFLNRITAYSSKDGDLTKNIRYTVKDPVNNMMNGAYSVEYYVTDSCGKTTYFDTEIEITESKYSAATITLKDYLVYLPKGSDFDYRTYYKSCNIEGKLEAVGKIDTNKIGTQYLDLYVVSENIAAKTRLTVVIY